MFKIVTLSDSNYFDSGKLFLQTRNVVNNYGIVLYGPDLTKEQQQTLKANRIEYEIVPKNEWDTKMQFLKFQFCLNEMNKDKDKKIKGFHSNDLDIFFVNDWKHLYDYDFDLALVARPASFKKRLLRALVCGGGFHFKHGAKELFEYAQKVIYAGGDPTLPEYDRIWQTLEHGRPANKTHFRTTLRWWVDQIFLSSIALRFIEKKNFNIGVGLQPVFFDFRGFKIALISEKNYNALDSKPVLRGPEKNIFVRHLKESGRVQLVGSKGKVKEKLDG
jgi:hypothetical protein